MSAGRRKEGAQVGLVRRVCGHALAVVAALLLFVAAPGVASAEAGRPTGWTLDAATAQVSVGRVDLHYDPDVADEAQWLAARIPAWWSGIERDLAGDIDDTLRITFVKHAGGVARATGMPQWVAGVANPPRGEIAIALYGPDGAPTNLEELLKHEMAHVALHRAVGGAALPRWFHEGVAESFTGTVSLARAHALAGAVFGAGVKDLEGLERDFRSGDGVDASVAYAAARDLVLFLRAQDEHGAQFRQVLGELRMGHGFEASFVRAYGRGLPELVRGWRQDLPGRFVWYPMVASGGMPFFVMIPLIGLAWRRRRRILDASWARIELEEARARAAALGLPAAPFAGHA